MTKHVVVIGAGIVGVSTGIWLRRMGAEVTIVDKGAPGQGTSFGNAGILASCAVVPVTTPGLLMKGPGMLLDRDFPLFMRWSYLPKLLPWLVRYLRNANDSDTRRIIKGVAGIVGDSVEQHQSLTDGLAAAQEFVTPSDYVFAYKDKASFDKDKYVWDRRREEGFVPEILQGQQVRDYDSAYGPAIDCLAVMKEHGFITDPGNYVAALADAFVAMGGTLMQAEVKDVTLDGGRISQVETSTGPVLCDTAVLAGGVWSKPLMKKLGINVPLESERGYHIVFEDPQGGPKKPSMIASGKFVATPMKAGLRCAGIVEFGGLEAGMSDAPLDLLRRTVREAFPNLTWKSEEPWLGHRPATTDSLPLIGEVNSTGVFAAFGHQHIGLTAGPKTGRIVAGMITNQPTNLDVTAYAPQRFNQ
ncbi:NAD(P)/FAD-dependent oxidoreductase [Pelagimonas varians]|uniref:D-amino acid dehydrogenase small subunit n=1 Tax=Pelagimonas varians TaxID=696760 RepID=A0A238KWJ9_9RHOB|nr:FAD-binding oxidoreductase [Pelagimonas varians]PYG28316.1 D-amino-acid dehydrogenase [Pelagimonas varians]SMX46456.1 D-amino acid dehydrogenase small subunit [Pelagimonas varians]